MKINGAWEETQDDKFICRWCVAWDAVGPDKIAGAVAGYAGGGASSLSDSSPPSRRTQLLACGLTTQTG